MFLFEWKPLTNAPQTLHLTVNVRRRLTVRRLKAILIVEIRLPTLGGILGDFGVELGKDGVWERRDLGI